MKTLGELERKVNRLMKKQRRAPTTNGPHPHHPPQIIIPGQLH